jgi:hypothetical protein
MHPDEKTSPKETAKTVRCKEHVMRSLKSFGLTLSIANHAAAGYVLTLFLTRIPKSGSARAPRAVFGGSPKTSSHKCSGPVVDKLWNEGLGGPPKPARQRRALPGQFAIHNSSFGLRVQNNKRPEQFPVPAFPFVC